MALPKNLAAFRLADEINCVAGFMESILDLLFEEADTAAMSQDSDVRRRAHGNIATLLDCGNRYVADIQRLCAEGLQAARNGGDK